MQLFYMLLIAVQQSCNHHNVLFVLYLHEFDSFFNPRFENIAPDNTRLFLVDIESPTATFFVIITSSLLVPHNHTSYKNYFFIKNPN